MNKRIYQLMIGGLIVVAILATIMYQSLESTVFFHTPGELLAKPQEFRDRTVRIGALVVRGSTEWDPDNVLLKFRVTEDDRTAIPVVFAGVKPDMYREGQGVVVEGRLDASGVFRADNLLVKHSEEYTVDPEKRMDKEAAYRSLMNKN